MTMQNGDDKSAEINQACRRCDGRGFMRVPLGGIKSRKTCARCNGSGILPVTKPQPPCAQEEIKALTLNDIKELKADKQRLDFLDALDCAITIHRDQVKSDSRPKIREGIDRAKAVLAGEYDPANQKEAK